MEPLTSSLAGPATPLLLPLLPALPPVPSTTGPLGLSAEGAPPAPGRQGQEAGVRKGWESWRTGLGGQQSRRLQDPRVPGWVMGLRGWLWAPSARGLEELLTSPPFPPHPAFFQEP